MCNNVRPRTQWASWATSSYPYLSTILAGLGITPKTIADFPIPFSTLLTTNTLFTKLIAGGLNLSETKGGTIAAVPLTTTFNQMFSTASITDYRWIDITQAQALHTALGIPFVFNETAIPSTLQINGDAFTFVQLDSNAAGSGITDWTPNGRAFGWVEDSSGEWVFDVETNVIRNEIEETDYNVQLYGDATPESKLYNVNFGDLAQRLFIGLESYFPTGIRGTQLILAHKYVLYRKYGDCDASCIIFPRNYADFQPRDWTDSIVNYGAKGTFGNVILPRVSVEVEDISPDVQDLREDEAIIQTDIENAIFQIVKHAKPF